MKQRRRKQRWEIERDAICKIENVKTKLQFLDVLVGCIRHIWSTAFDRGYEKACNDINEGRVILSNQVTFCHKKH